MKPAVTLTRKDNLPEVKRQLRELTKTDVLVGVPAANSDRGNQLLDMLAKAKPGKAQKRLGSAVGSSAVDTINNAELLYVLTNGSPLHHIPATPIVEGAIQYRPNRDMIADKMKDAAAALLDGKPQEARRQLKLTGTLATSLVKAWFTNPANQWPPNAPSTVARKGSARRNIDLGALRRAITWVLRLKGQ